MTTQQSTPFVDLVLEVINSHNRELGEWQLRAQGMLALAEHLLEAVRSHDEAFNDYDLNTEFVNWVEQQQKDKELADLLATSDDVMASGETRRDFHLRMFGLSNLTVPQYSEMANVNEDLMRQWLKPNE